MAKASLKSIFSCSVLENFTLQSGYKNVQSLQVLLVTVFIYIYFTDFSFSTSPVSKPLIRKKDECNVHDITN